MQLQIGVPAVPVVTDEQLHGFARRYSFCFVVKCYYLNLLCSHMKLCFLIPLCITTLVCRPEF